MMLLVTGATSDIGMEYILHMHVRYDITSAII